MHHKRSEHWIIIAGTAFITRDNEQFVLGKNESTYIPMGMKHRIENRNDHPLEIVEIQTGSYFGEDDIIRFDDDYQREAYLI